MFWYRKNCPTFGQFLAFFFVENMDFDFKLTQIYQYSIFFKSDTYFIRFIHYKQEHLFFL